jgi:enoyl-CoA hydratase
MLLTGRTINAAEAVEWGLVSRLAAHDELIEVATDALIAACRSAPVARADTKRSLDAYYGLYDRIGMINSLRGSEALEGYHAFVERRPPSWIPDELPSDGRL